MPCCADCTVVEDKLLANETLKCGNKGCLADISSMSDTRQLLEQLQHCTVRRERYRNFLQTLIERGAGDKVIQGMRKVVADEEQECRRIEAALLHRIPKN